jgi:hypothetical protein
MRQHRREADNPGCLIDGGRLHRRRLIGR